MKKKKKGFLLAFPAISGFLFFYLIPFLIVLWYSVSFGIGKREFVGLDNYKELFKNTMFLLAVKNTCKYMLVTIPVTLGTALYFCNFTTDYERSENFPTLFSLSNHHANRIYSFSHPVFFQK